MSGAVIVAAAESGHSPLVPAPGDLIWATLCFLVILFFFWKFGVPRFTKLLDERSAAIEGNIAKAEEAEEKAEAALEKYTAQLAEARAEAARIREQARTDGKNILAELKEQASAEAARITEHAQAQIESERHAAVVSLRQEVGSLAISLASGVIGESLTNDKKASAIVDRFLAELDSDSLSADQANSR